MVRLVRLHQRAERPRLPVISTVRPGRAERNREGTNQPICRSCGPRSSTTSLRQRRSYSDHDGWTAGRPDAYVLRQANQVGTGGSVQRRRGGDHSSNSSHGKHRGSHWVSSRTIPTFSFAIFLDCTIRIFPDSGVPFTGFDCWSESISIQAFSPGAEAISPKLHDVGFIVVEELIALVDRQNRKIVSVFPRWK